MHFIGILLKIVLEPRVLRVLTPNGHYLAFPDVLTHTPLGFARCPYLFYDPNFSRSGMDILNVYDHVLG